MTESEDLAAAEALACISCSPPPKALNIFQSPFGEKVSALSPNVRDVTDPDATNSLRGSPGPYMESPMWLLTPFAAENIQSPEVFSGSVSSIPSISSSGDHGARRLFQEDTTVKKEESTKQRRALTIVQNQIKPKSHNKSPIVIKAGKATGAVQRRHLSKSPLKNELDTADLANSSSSSSTSSSSSSSASRTPLRNGGAGSKTSSPQSTTSPNSLRGSVASPVLARKGGHSTPDSLAYLSADRRNPCNCKKSKCLKLYCECFSANLYCMGCNCLDCANNAEHMTMREQAVKQTLERNPNAFKPKINASPSVGTTQHSHSKGCHCKKSNCLKKYCECFLGEVFCGDNCKCLSCKNYEGSADLKKRRDSNAAKAYNAGMCKFNAGGKGNLPASGLIKLGVAASSLAKEQLPVKRKVPAVERDRDNMFVKKKCVRTSDRG